MSWCTRTTTTIQTLARLGGKRHLSELSALLDDRAECAERAGGENDETIKTLICDVALAAMVYVTGQKLDDYGMDEVQSVPFMLFDVRTLGFADPKAREAALKKWRAWVDANRESMKEEG